MADPIVSIAFLSMRPPKLGDYYEVAQSIRSDLNGEPILFRPAMYGSVAAVLQGRECWGLPKKFAAPMLRLRDDTVVGTLRYRGPGALELYHHALAPLAGLPVREIVSVTHTVCDATLQIGEVVHDYLT